LTTPLRTRLDELEIYVIRVAEATGIAPTHVEKDFWITEVLRGASNPSAATGCSVIFKGGTSLSKAHQIIHRFSEDVDLVVVLPEGSKGNKNSTLKTFVRAAESTTGLRGSIDPKSAAKGGQANSDFRLPHEPAVCSQAWGSHGARHPGRCTALPQVAVPIPDRRARSSR